jgi:sirohydrochlorin ferrochelatase
MTDNERIAAYLREHGSVTSYEIRVMELSGNPSQRIAELVAEGFEIAQERFHRVVRGKKRPCCRYVLISSPAAPDGAASTNPPSKDAAPVSDDPQSVPLFELDSPAVGHLDLDQREVA